MLLDIVILVLRETLEAGALLSVLLCVSTQHKLNLNWLWIGLVLGCTASVFYAINFSNIGEMFNYAGQELLNATMLLTICLGLVVLCYFLIFQKPRFLHPVVAPIMACVTTLVVARELVELVIFFTGLIQSQGDIGKAATSGFIGLMIGTSFGVLCYVAIHSWRASISRRIQITMFTLIAAGMSVQATQLLIQIDWISASKPLWDTNWILTESSITGQLTYAIFGYEATPTAHEIIFYNIIVITVIA
ncbi:MAG: hypothetical protein JKX81_10785, partial [Arenicella sp.]|nr:hypothetical protein [Arenicella sp.]